MCDIENLQALGLDSPITSDTLDKWVSADSPVSQILSTLCKWLAQDFYLDCSEKHFNTATDFINATQYMDPVQNKTGAGVAKTLLGRFDSAWTSVQTIASMWDVYDDIGLFRFPSLVKVNLPDSDASEGSVTVALRLPVNSTTGLESHVQTWLHNFYGDSQWGAYTRTMTDTMAPLSDPQYIPNTITRNSAYDAILDQGSAATTVLYGFTIQMKLSFISCLYQLIGEATNTGDSKLALISTLTPVQFDQIKIDASVPYPAVGHTVQADFCASQDDCACLYFVVMRSMRTSHDMPLTTPAHNLYVNRFQEPNCLCYVSRAVPLGESQTLNPFGLCFDQNCLDPTVDRSNLNLACEDQCGRARETMSGVNWQNDFLNPSIVNTSQVKSTCNMEVSSISSDPDRWAPAPYLVAGTICFGMSVPLYVLASSILQKRYTFSIWHVLLFLATSAIGGIGSYALVGKYVCLPNAAQLDTQAACFDRLSGLVPLSKECCDQADPLFCQCDPANDIQQVCRSAVPTTFCKCQNNGLCIPTSGNSSILSGNPVRTYAFNYQLVFLFVSIFALVTPLATLGVRPLQLWSGVTHWAVTVMLHTLVILSCFTVIVAVPLILTYSTMLERTHVVDVQAQNKVCSLDYT